MKLTPDGIRRQVNLMNEVYVALNGLQPKEELCKPIGESVSQTSYAYSSSSDAGISSTSPSHSCAGDASDE